MNMTPEELEDAYKILGQCDECGQQAITIVQDVREVTKPWDSVRGFAPDGPRHRFCQAHAREPVEHESSPMNNITPAEWDDWLASLLPSG